jgi:hypothetical protein
VRTTAETNRHNCNTASGPVGLNRFLPSVRLWLVWMIGLLLALPVAAFASNPQVPQGGSTTFAPTTSGSTGGAWSITNPSGTVIACQGPPTPGINGWSVSFTTSQSSITTITVTAPSTAIVGTNYLVAVSGPGSTNAGHFDVISSGGSSSANLTGLSLSVYTVAAGGSVTGTVSLSAAAPSSGVLVTLSSSNTTAATVPSSVTVPSGAATANFTVTAAQVTTATTTSLTASYAGTSLSQTLTVGPPPAPTGLTATGGTAQVSLNWTAASGASTYDVYRGTASGGEGNTPLATGVTGTSYSDATASPGVRYYYQVTALSGGGQSARSNEASATALAAGPSKLTATGEDEFISLAWTAVSGATGYNLYYASPSGQGGYTYSLKQRVSGTDYDDTPLPPNTSETYAVTALGAWGESAYSSVASAVSTPGAPTTTASKVQLTDLFMPLTALLQWQPGGHQSNSYFVTRNSAQIADTGSTYLFDSAIQIGTHYTYDVQDHWTDPPYYNNTTQQWVYPSGITDLGSIKVTPEQATVTDNQSVDARYDPRYATWTFLNFNFGSMDYRGGLYAGYNADNSQVGHSYLKFGLAPVPQGETLWPIGSVNTYFLRMYASGTTAFPEIMGVACQSVSALWSGSTLVWSNAPSFTPSASGLTQCFVAYDGTPDSVGWAHWEMGSDIPSALSGGSGLYAAALGGSSEPVVGTSGPPGGAAMGWAYFAKSQYPGGQPACVLYAYSN